MPPGRRPRPLQPEDVPEEHRTTFHFDHQTLRQWHSKQLLVIDRTCRNCGEGFASSVTQIRSDLARGRRVLGLCGPCAKTPGPHQTGRRKLVTGRYTNAQGYVLLWRPEHPEALKQKGYVLEHRLVMEEILDRPLRPGENVHHRNGQRADNRQENLELWVVNQPSGQRAGEGQHCPSCTCSP